MFKQLLFHYYNFGIVCEKEVVRLLLHTPLQVLIGGLVNAGQFDLEGMGFMQNIYSMGNAQCRNADSLHSLLKGVVAFSV